ncbi:MAG TPA: PilN domain-containing protein [Candidatus Saccharimonadales bacterium]
MNKVEFNLLPDVKMDVVKASRARNTVVSIAFLASAASLAILVLLLFTVYIVQNKQLSDANKDIENANNKLKNISSLDKILTVQKQLQTLPGLHENKHISSRLFSYLPQVTPTSVSIGSLSVDMAANVIQISGTAESQHAVNTFIDTLKFTTYTTAAGSSPKDAFPTVIESNFTLSSAQVSYLLDVHFDPALFSNNQLAPTLQVPTITTTRSVIDNPSNQLFTGQTGNKKEEQ